MRKVRGALSAGSGISVLPLLFAGVASVMVVAPSADAFVYWANSNGSSLGRSATDGTAADQGYVSASGPCGVAVDGTYVYWANQGGNETIGRARLDGTQADQSFIPTTGNPCGVAVDDNFVYWGNESQSIGRANLDGTGVNQNFVDVPGSTPCGVAVDSGHVYWASFGGPNQSVGRAEIDGGNVEPLWIDGATKPCGVAVNQTNVFWANRDSNSIGRATIVGGSVDQAFITGAHAPCGVGVDANFVYWGNSGFPGTGTTIGRSTLDGSVIQPNFIDGASSPCGVTADSNALPTCQGVSASTPVNQPITLRLTCSGQGPLAYQVLSRPANGQTYDLQTATGQVRYAPIAGFTGQDTFAFTASNIGGNAVTATATVTVGQAGLGPSFSIDGVKRNKNAGTATMTMSLQAPGQLRMVGGSVKTMTEESVDPGAVEMKVAPDAATRRRLRREGDVKVKVRVSHKPTGAPRSTRSRGVRLVLKP